jgi:hypothetical protein
VLASSAAHDREYEGSSFESHDQSILRKTNPQLPVRVPKSPLGARRLRPADTADHAIAPQREVHHSYPETKETQGTGGTRFRRRQRAIEDDVRLTYVAITRATHEAFLTYSRVSPLVERLVG